MEKSKNYLKENIELAIAPIFFLVFFFGINWLWHYFNLPNQDGVAQIIQGFFKEYGLWVVFLSSILESILLVGMYFPGTLVIFLGVSATFGNPLLGLKTVLVVIAGMLCGYTINYFLGKYGWHKMLEKMGFRDELQKIEQSVTKKGLLGGTFTLYVFPGTGSLLSTALGVLRYNFYLFLPFTLASIVFFDTIWGFLAYFFGMKIFKLLTNSFVMFAVFCVYFYYMYNKRQESLASSLPLE